MFLALDREYWDWTGYAAAVVIAEDGSTTYLDNQDALANTLRRHPGKVFALWGSKLDFLDLSPLQNVSLAGGTIVRAQYGRCHLRDAARLFPESLKAVGQSTGLPKFEGRSDQMDSLTPDEIWEHCERDTQILWGGLHAHRKWCLEQPHPEPRWPSTAGATAVYLAEAFEPDLVAHLNRNTLDLASWRRHAEAVTGGRCEMWWQGRMRGVFCYDIRSSYPASWLQGPVPLGPWRWVGAEQPDALGIYWCPAIRQNRARLPVVQTDNRWGHEGAGWCTSGELHAIRQSGGTVQVDGGWVSGTVAPFFQTVARFLFTLKEHGSLIGKPVINSMHGKACQGLVGEVWRHTPGGYEVDRTLQLPAWFQRPLIAAEVYARARLRLHAVLEALLAAGWRVYYCDTDSVHTDCPPDRFPVPLSDACGGWRLEHGPCEALYLAPKLYGLRNGSGQVVKLVSAGLHRGALTWRHLEEANAGQRVIVDYRGGVVGFRSLANGQPLRVGSQIRQVRSSAGGKQRGANHGEATPLLYPSA